MRISTWWAECVSPPRAGPEESRAIQLACAREAIEAQKADWVLEPAYPPFVAHGGGPSPEFIYYYPVRIDRKSPGLLATAVGFGPAIQIYLLPLQSRPVRRAYLPGADRKMLWSPASEELGLHFAPSPWPDGEVSERSFRLGDYPFTVLVADDTTSLHAGFLLAEQLRSIVFLAGLALIAAADGVAFRLTPRRARRSPMPRQTR
jgi:hypothetical protein